MMTRLALASVVVLLFQSCTRSEPAHFVPVPPPATATVAPRRSSVTDASAGVSVSSQSPAALPSLVPLANGKRLRLQGVGSADSGEGVGPLEITVPPKFRLKMKSSEDELPSAHLKGPDLEVIVEVPESGFSTLAEHKSSVSLGDATATFLRAEETPAGFLLIDQTTVPGIGRRFNAIVSRPELKVICTADSLTRLSEAERAASICLSLRPVPENPGI